MGNICIKRLDEQIIFDQLEGDENAIWSLFLASGYLKAEGYTFNKETGTVYNGFIRALLQDDIKRANPKVWFRI